MIRHPSSFARGHTFNHITGDCDTWDVKLFSSKVSQKLFGLAAVLQAHVVVCCPLLNVIHGIMELVQFWLCVLNTSYRVTPSMNFTSSTSVCRSSIMFRKFSADNVPRGTPLAISVQSDVVSASLTLCVLLVKNAFCQSTHIRGYPGTPFVLSLSRGVV